MGQQVSGREALNKLLQQLAVEGVLLLRQLHTRGCDAHCDGRGQNLSSGRAREPREPFELLHRTVFVGGEMQNNAEERRGSGQGLLLRLLLTDSSTSMVDVWEEDAEKKDEEGQEKDKEEALRLCEELNVDYKQNKMVLDAQFMEEAAGNKEMVQAGGDEIDVEYYSCSPSIHYRDHIHAHTQARTHIHTRAGNYVEKEEGGSGKSSKGGWLASQRGVCVCFMCVSVSFCLCLGLRLVS